MANLKELAATGDVVAQGIGRSSFLQRGVLTAGSADATAVLRTGGSGGTRKVTLAAPAGTSVVYTSAEQGGAFFADGIHLTLAGTGATCDLEWT